jgi:quercetin dioxygenase-like cupin family protein
MPKTTQTYWNPLLPENRYRWKAIAGMEGMAEELTLAIDRTNGDYTRLTRFMPGADTSAFGAKSHDYPEEIMILEGSLYDAAFDMWLKAGDYASRPPGEVHGPFTTADGCVVLELSFPSQSVGQGAADP